MSTHPRNNFKWGVQEILSLQREFQLLHLSIDEIAKKHKRTPRAIMLKLDKEGMADYNSLYTHYYESSLLIPDGEIKMEIVSQDGSELEQEEDEQEEEEQDEKEEEQEDDDSEYIDEENGSEYYGDYDEDDEDDEDPLTKRVEKLEADIKEILKTLKELSSKIKS